MIRKEHKPDMQEIKAKISDILEKLTSETFFYYYIVFVMISLPVTEIFDGRHSQVFASQPIIVEMAGFLGGFLFIVHFIKHRHIKYYPSEHMNSPQYTDSNSSVDEGLEDYKIDGYHPVHIGEILLERYIIMQKLGYGHFSTAWLALDSKYGNYVCIKIQKSEERYIWAAYDEVEILQELAKHYYDKEWIKSLEEYYKDEPEKLKKIYTKENSHVVQLLNSFIYHGQNGKHFCMVFEVMGVTLLELIKRYDYKGLPIPLVRVITKQILIGLDFLHRICHIIHTDMKPENILICLTNDELREIQKTGTYNVSNKKNGKNNYMAGGGGMDIKKFLEEKRKKQVREIKKMVKSGIYSNETIEEKIKKIMENENNDNDSFSDNKDKDINLENNNSDKNFDIDDLIERPRISSVPKNKIILLSQDINEKKSNENSDKELDKLINNNKELLNEKDLLNIKLFEKTKKNSEYEINLKLYSLVLQNYIKEKNRLLHDINYRKQIISKKKLSLNNANNEDSINKYCFSSYEPELSIEVKICDIGNACWFNNHFSTIIQTRQYRSPEVILGINYNESSDIWSLACIIFELVTGDFLFNPTSSEYFCKNDSHLAKFMEVCGKMPKNFVERGEYWKKYFTKDGKLKRMGDIKHIILKNLLVQKYHIKENEALALSNFLMPMLEYLPEKRISARELLKHPWLKMPNCDSGKLSEFDVFKMNVDEDYLYDGIEEFNYYYKNENNLDFKRDVYDSDENLYEGDDEDNSEYELNKNNYKNKLENIKNNNNNDKDSFDNEYDIEFDRPNTQFNCINQDKNTKNILNYI